MWAACNQDTLPKVATWQADCKLAFLCDVASACASLCLHFETALPALLVQQRNSTEEQLFGVRTMLLNITMLVCHLGRPCALMCSRMVVHVSILTDATYAMDD
jgi:ABC-type transport system involved in Fe-S cluster assembly fused permease/ATPase subunit